MEDIVGMIRSIVRQEMAEHWGLELGIVTRLHSRESGGDKDNYACSVKLKDSNLELQNVTVASQRIGSVAIPNEGDLVIVQFIHGDVSNAVIIGRLYSDIDRPPVAKPQEFVYISPDQKKSDVRRAYMEFPNGNKLLLEDGGIKIESGLTKITISNSGDVKMECPKKIILQASGAISLDAAGDVSIDSKASISLKAAGGLTLEAATVDVKGTASTQVQSSGMTTLRGSLVTLGGQITFSP